VAERAKKNAEAAAADAEEDDPAMVQGLLALAEMEDEAETDRLLAEAASFNQEVYNILKEPGQSEIILPKHVRYRILSS